MNWYRTLKKLAAIEEGPKAKTLNDIGTLKKLMSPLKSDEFVRTHILHDGLRKMFMKIDGILTNMEGMIHRGQFEQGREMIGQASLVLNSLCEELNGLAQQSQYRMDYTRFPAVVQFDQIQERIYQDLTRLQQMNRAPAKPQQPMGQPSQPMKMPATAPAKPMAWPKPAPRSNVG